MATPARRAALRASGIHYPESDGSGVGQSDWHLHALCELRSSLKYWFRDRRVYVATRMFLYYEQGNPRARVSPDVMVVAEVENHFRESFKTWHENAVPSVIIEIVADSSIREDLVKKPKLYSRLGVAEYFVFDPLGDVVEPRLQGLTLVDGRYVPVRPSPGGSLVCSVFGLRLRPLKDRLRLIDLATGERLLSDTELAAVALRFERQDRRADALVAELAPLQAQPTMLRKPKK